MGMDLVPVYEGEEPSGDPAEVQLSAVEINAIGVRTAVARIEPIAQRIDTVGFVRYDEHLTSHIHTRVDGWIENLSVRAIGDRVAEGDLLFTIYAPEITIGSAELLRATQRGDQTEIAIARRKLRNFGVSERQIDEMALADEPAQFMRVYAPQDGVVIALEAADGMYLKPDVRAMSLADLSTVWLFVDVFERDIGRLSGEKMAYARFEHLPGRVFEGEIDYIYPELDATTRTLPIRLRFDNAEGLLRPNMFGNVTLVPEAEAGREAVTVPSEAVIRTGRAERVILRTGKGTFKPRLVTTGLTDSFGAGGRTEIVQGLTAGEEVVASAQFLIDSESALNAGLMRMAPTEAEPARGTGLLVDLDLYRRLASIRHQPIEALDWPGMETRFTVRADVVLDGLEVGADVEFAAARGADGQLALIELGADDGIDATGTGIVQAVTPDGKLTLTHDPIPALGWPSMQMDMPVAGLDPAAVPLDVPIVFDLVKDDGGMFTIVAVRPEGATDTAPSDPSTDMDGEPVDAPDMRVMSVNGTVNVVDLDRRMANITHEALVEIGMPGMTMDFAFAPDVRGDSVVEGPAALEIGIDETGALVLVSAEPRSAPMRVMGTINSVDPEDGMANITHGPLAEIGMPGMTMDFPLSGSLEPEALPIGVEVPLLIEQGGDLSLTLVGVDGEAGQ